MEVDDVEDHEVKEEEDDDVETDGVEKEDDDDVEDDHVEAQDGTHTLCKPAQSKCTSTCHKSYFIYGRLQGKRRAQLEHPDQALTGLYHYRNNPSV